MTPEPRTAAVVAAWLSHPATCLAVAVLLVNDHVLKTVAGSWWTGKLSDVAGLVVAPPLVAAAAWCAGRLAGRHDRLRPGALAWGAVLTVGLAFVGVKTTHVGSAAASDVWSALAGDGVVLRDPTDLLALPALAIAWAVARRAAQPPVSRLPRRRPEPARWLALVPIAVVATVATTTGDPVHLEGVGVLHGQAVVVTSYQAWTSGDGRSWTPLGDPPELVALRDDVEAARTARTKVCVPAVPDECFRPALGLGVERSVDGGASWALDWFVPADVVAELEARYRRPSGEIRTYQVAVWTTDDGFRVLADDAPDGLALRSEDGTWERIGAAYQDHPDPVVPLPGEPTSWWHPVPWSVVLGTLAALVTVLSSGNVPARRRAGRVAGGGFLVLVGVVGLAVLAGHNQAYAQVAGQGGGVEALVLPVLLGHVLVAVMCGAVLVRRGHAVLPALLTGVTVALAGLLVGQPVVAAILMVGATVGGVVLARRRVRGAPAGASEPVAPANLARAEPGADGRMGP